MTDFALLGAAGFVAERHLRAIRDTGNRLVAAMDPHDAVGVLDRYAPDAHFFVEFERFDRHLDQLRRRGEGVSHVSICSPNHLHDPHVRFGLRTGADVICEKPLVLDPADLDSLTELEQETGKRVYTVLQLRLHPSLVRLREQVLQRVAADPDVVFDVDLAYLTSRGRWYGVSWKGDEAKSGGVATNIGIHFFDMLQWVFGPVSGHALYRRSPDTAAGLLELRHARVRWLLSIDAGLLPREAVDSGQRTYRSLRTEGEEVEFSSGFTELHTQTYARILAGDGFGIEDARPSLELVHGIRHDPLSAEQPGGLHPLLQR